MTPPFSKLSQVAKLLCWDRQHRRRRLLVQFENRFGVSTGRQLRGDIIPDFHARLDLGTGLHADMSLRAIRLLNPVRLLDFDHFPRHVPTRRRGAALVGGREGWHRALNRRCRLRRDRGLLLAQSDRRYAQTTDYQHHENHMWCHDAPLCLGEL